jgi:hypothetical protein
MRYTMPVPSPAAFACTERGDVEGQRGGVEVKKGRRSGCSRMLVGGRRPVWVASVCPREKRATAEAWTPYLTRTAYVTDRFSGLLIQ